MDSIRFKNYRCFTDTGEVKLKTLTFLLGANNSGKSSFLKFFPLLKQSVGFRRNGIFLWYANDVDFKDFGNAVKRGEESIEISWKYDDFSVNETWGRIRFKNIPNIKKLFSSKIQLNISMTISAKKDNSDRLKKLKIEFLDEAIELNIDERGHIVAVVNDRVFESPSYTMRLNDSVYFLPRILFYFEKDGDKFSSTYPRFIELEKIFEDEDMKNIKELMISNNALYLNKKDYLSLFKYFIDKEGLDYDYFRDLFLLANLNDIIETINYRIMAEAYQLSYVKPLRVMPERFYRYQNYAVDEIDSDGKNLAMFIANLSELELIRFQKWTNNNFGFKIFPVKHEGHVELTIGKEEEDARNLVDMGFGYTQLLPIITIIWNSLNGKGRSFFYPRVGETTKTIAIEQPELHLHPRIQSIFAEVLVKVINSIPSNVDVRFIIETHSEAIINRIGAMIQTGELDKEKVNVVMFNGINEGLEDYVVEANFDDNGFLTKWPLGFFL